MTLLIPLALVSGLILIGAGLWIERRPKPVSPVPLLMSPALPPPGEDRPVGPAAGWWARFRQAASRHPAPIFAVLETGMWLLVLLTMIEALRSPRSGPVSFAVWALTIGPHEIGHLLCLPFGWFLNIAGGSIGQLLIFILPAIFAFAIRRQITTSLLFWAMTGHSLINLAQYIGDARARKLPLLFGMSKEHHDWWNLLRDLGLLRYDHLLAALTRVGGAGLIVLAAGLGIVTAWVLPRTRLGPVPRFEGNVWRALKQALAGSAGQVH